METERIDGVVRLRIMTFKSVIGFGRYTYRTVRQVIDINKKLDLVKMYYQLEGISFTQDVLNEIGIYTDLQISKPGRNPESFGKYIKMIRDKFKEDDPSGYLKSKSMRMKHMKDKIKRNTRRTAKSFYKKSVLQSRNQKPRGYSQQ